MRLLRSVRAGARRTPRLLVSAALPPLRAGRSGYVAERPQLLPTPGRHDQPSCQEQAAAGGQDSVTLPRSPDTFDGQFVIALPRRRVTDSPPSRCLGRRLHGPPPRATAHRFGAMRTQRRVNRRVEDPTSERLLWRHACHSSVLAPAQISDRAARSRKTQAALRRGARGCGSQHLL